MVISSFLYVMKKHEGFIIHIFTAFSRACQLSIRFINKDQAIRVVS